jgi:hypothetical protein
MWCLWDWDEVAWPVPGGGGEQAGSAELIQARLEDLIF